MKVNFNCHVFCTIEREMSIRHGLYVQKAGTEVLCR